MLPCDPTAADAKNKGSIARWNRIKQSKEVQLYGRLYCDICTVSQYSFPGVRLQIGLTKAKQMNKSTDSKTYFKFIDAQLLVNRVRPNPTFLLVHNTALSKGCLVRYNLTIIKLKSFTFSSGSKSLSIDNAVL
jgi:hypothetical protein